LKSYDLVPQHWKLKCSINLLKSLKSVINAPHNLKQRDWNTTASNAVQRLSYRSGLLDFSAWFIKHAFIWTRSNYEIKKHFVENRTEIMQHVFKCSKFLCILSTQKFPGVFSYMCLCMPTQVFERLKCHVTWYQYYNAEAGCIL
jgi:hypothetical protein